MEASHVIMFMQASKNIHHLLASPKMQEIIELSSLKKLLEFYVTYGL